jgi:hypothetical protein
LLHETTADLSACVLLYKHLALYLPLMIFILHQSQIYTAVNSKNNSHSTAIATSSNTEVSSNS